MQIQFIQQQKITEKVQTQIEFIFSVDLNYIFLLDREA